MLLQNVVLSFPNLLTAKTPKGSTKARWDTNILIAPDHPQSAEVTSLYNAAVAAGYPDGVPASTNVCFGLYETQVDSTKSYYDPRFVGYHKLQVTRNEDDKRGRPGIIDMSHNPIIDPAQIYSGCMAHVNFDITYYEKGSGGIGGWLNATMLTGQECQFGRLDGQPSLEQMFAGIGSSPAAAPVAPPPPSAPVAAGPARQMTAKANGATYEQFIEAGHTDESMIRDGYMLPPGGVPLSFT